MQASLEDTNRSHLPSTQQILPALIAGCFAKEQKKLPVLTEVKEKEILDSGKEHPDSNYLGVRLIGVVILILVKN